MPCRLCSSSCFANPPCEAGVRSALRTVPRERYRKPWRANPPRGLPSQTWRAAMPCSSSRPSNPASEPDVRVEPPRESRRAAVPCALSRFAKPPCELLPNVRRRQDFAVVRSWAAVRGNILARCVPRWPSVAIFRRGAFLGGYPWQFSRFMHPRRGLGREKRPFLATYRRHVSKTSWLWQDMRAMHPKSPANRLSGMHSAQILPGRVPFRRTGPSNHTWGVNFAREPPLYGPLESYMACESCQGSSLYWPLESRQGAPPDCIDPSNHASCADLAILWRSWPFGDETPSPKDGMLRLFSFGGASPSILVW